MTCSTPKCRRKVARVGMCRKCYDQTEHRKRSEPGEGAQVSFRCAVDLKEEVDRVATHLGVDSSEMWRRLALAGLSSYWAKFNR